MDSLLGDVDGVVVDCLIGGCHREVGWRVEGLVRGEGAGERCQEGDEGCGECISCHDGGGMRLKIHVLMWPRPASFNLSRSCPSKIIYILLCTILQHRYGARKYVDFGPMRNFRRFVSMLYHVEVRFL